jgi:predicted GIY-YIG superfamily endonuclease
VLTNAEGEIIYIGQATNLRSRLTQHLDGGKRDALTTLGRASFVWHRRVAGKGALSALERGWLQSCEIADGILPPLNKITAPT